MSAGVRAACYFPRDRFFCSFTFKLGIGAATILVALILVALQAVWRKLRSPRGNMTRPSDSQDELRKNALTTFLDARIKDGYRIETRTDTHAIIAPAHRGRSFLDHLRKPKLPARQVISVDQNGEVTMRPAEPLRS